MNLNEQLAQLEALVTRGAILDAVDKFFHDDVVTKDPNAPEMHGKVAKRKFLEGFLNGIAKVNGITLLANAVGDNVTMSEYIFDFDMKDGSKILWQEVIRRQWREGKITNEKYYQN